MMKENINSRDIGIFEVRLQPDKRRFLFVISDEAYEIVKERNPFLGKNGRPIAMPSGKAHDFWWDVERFSELVNIMLKIRRVYDSRKELYERKEKIQTNIHRKRNANKKILSPFDEASVSETKAVTE